ncbi:MAG TPA: hypothetical protein VKT70_12100 [Stellaceae bacterium]|nr:hypothetical protein [Stellaceae bacterium]
MPFDGTLSGARRETLAKLDRTVSLIASEELWCKGRTETEDGRRCLLGAMRVAGAHRTLKAPVLRAAAEITGHAYRSIPRFNDDVATTHAVLLRVLERTRQDLLAESFTLDARHGFFGRMTALFTAH